MQQRIQLATGGGEIVPGSICTMTQRHLMQIETLWKNMLIEAAQADMGWDWDYKLRLATTDDRLRLMSLNKKMSCMVLYWLKRSGIVRS